MEKEYGPAIDLWSLGCTVAEIEGCSAKYLENEADSKDRVIFKGSSCFPLSPSDDCEPLSD